MNSFVYNLFLSGQMESKISEANSHEEIFISVGNILNMAISCNFKYGIRKAYL